jgi:putative membrane protein
MKRLVMIAALPLLALGACKSGANADSSTSTDSSMVSSGSDMGAGAMDSSGTGTSAMGTGAMGGASGGAMASGATAVVDAATYVAQAGASDLFEIDSSKAVLTKTKDAQVRKFAEKMIQDHTASTAKVKAAAKQAGIVVSPPRLSPDQQRMLDEIKSAPASNIDTVYIADQRTAHQNALSLHQSYAQSGDAPALKAVAAQIAPIVQQHIDMLSNMSAPSGQQS